MLPTPIIQIISGYAPTRLKASHSNSHQPDVAATMELVKWALDVWKISNIAGTACHDAVLFAVESGHIEVYKYVIDKMKPSADWLNDRLVQLSTAAAQRGHSEMLRYVAGGEGRENKDNDVCELDREDTIEVMLAAARAGHWHVITESERLTIVVECIGNDDNSMSALIHHILRSGASGYPCLLLLCNDQYGTPAVWDHVCMLRDLDALVFILDNMSTDRYQSILRHIRDKERDREYVDFSIRVCIASSSRKEAFELNELMSLIFKRADVSIIYDMCEKYDIHDDELPDLISIYAGDDDNARDVYSRLYGIEE